MVQVDTNELSNVAERCDPRANDFVIDRIGCVREVYPADPLTAHRCWKGPSDCSAEVHVRRSGTGRMAFNVVVTDDVAGPEDGVSLTFIGWKMSERHSLPCVSRDGMRTQYRGEIGEPSRRYERIRIEVADDDGEGEDLRLVHDFIPINDERQKGQKE